MKKLLLLLSVFLGTMSMFPSMAQDTETETFGNWFQPATKPADATETQNTSKTTGITYTSSYTYWNNGGSAILISYIKNTKGYIKFSLAYNVSKITIHTGTQNSKSAKINFVAGTTTISPNLALSNKNSDYSIDIPSYLQKSGTVYKIEIPASVSSNAQIAKITYTKASIGLGTLSATCNGEVVGSTLSIEEWAPITFHADNATSFAVTVDSQTTTLTATNGSATWTPDVCENAAISVTATDGTQTSAPLTFTLTVTPKQLGELTATYNNAPISDPLSIEQGSEITFHANNATSFAVTVDSQTTTLTATNGSATWTPDVCENAAISVTATDGTQTSDPLTFTLTVTPKTTITETITVHSFNYFTNTYAQKEFTSSITGITYSAVYAAGQSGDLITFNTGNKNLGKHSELVVTDNPKNYVLRKITIEFKDNAAAKLGINAYAQSNNNYTPADISGDPVTDIPGTSLGTLETTDTQQTQCEISCLPENNYTAVGLFPAIKSSTAMKSITLEWEEPEPEPITISYTPQYCIEAKAETPTELTIMAGTELTFSSANAAKMEITSTPAIDGLTTSSTGRSINWKSVDSNIYTITVKASSEKGTKTAEATYIIMTKVVTPTTPEIVVVDDGSAATVACNDGALMIKIEDYPTTENTPSVLALETTNGWIFSSDETPRDYTLDCSTIEEGRTILLSAKAVTPLTESDVVEKYLNNKGSVAGIENVAVDAENGKAIYYDLQGRRVNADRPGIYIRQQGAKAEKVVIR